jgi:hypothetical protein
MKTRRTLLCWTVAAGMLAGCAGVSPTQVGQTAGSIAGAALAPGFGMPLGALLGTLAGLVFEQQLDQVREKQERVELGDQLARPSSPIPSESSTPPAGIPTRVWVDERVESGRLLAGHFEVRSVP